MRFLYVDLNTGSLVESPGFPNPVTTLTVKRAVSTVFGVKFLNANRQVVELSEGATGKLGFKEFNKYDADYVVSALSWEKEGTGEDAVYKFAPNFNTVELNALIGHNPPETSDDKSYVNLMGEIEWVEDGVISKTKTFIVRVDNDVNKGTEGIPASSNLHYPMPEELELQTNKGQPDGYASLDASGKIPNEQLPPLAITSVQVVADQAARLALANVQEGDAVKQTDNGRAYLFSGGDPLQESNWVEIGDTAIDIADVSNLQSALDAKADLTDPRFFDARTPLAHQHTHADVTDLGDAAIKNVGSSAGMVCAGDDARLSNTRTPTAHAANHVNGTDDIQLATASQRGLMSSAYASKLEEILSKAESQMRLNARAAAGGIYIPSNPYYRILVADTASLDVNTKDFTLEMELQAVDWTDAATLLDCVSGSNGLKLEKLSDAKLRLTVGDGSGLITATSSAALPVADGRVSIIHVVVIRGANDATVNFYCDGAAVGTQQTLTGLALAENVIVPTTLAVKIEGGQSSGILRGYQPILRNYAMSATEILDELAQGIRYQDVGCNYSYPSNFSAGVDGWSALRGTVDGNQDGVLGEDDWLRFYANNVNNYHAAYRYFTAAGGKRVRLSFDFYIPNSGGTTYLDGIIVSAEGYYSQKAVTTVTTVGSKQSVSVDFFMDNAEVLYFFARKGGSKGFIGANSPTDDLFYIKNVKLEVLGCLCLLDCSVGGVQKRDLSGYDNHGLLYIDGSIPSVPDLLLAETCRLESVLNHTADGWLLNDQPIIPKGYFIDAIIVKNDTANAVTINVGYTAGGSQIVSGAVIGASANVYCTISNRLVAKDGHYKVHINSTNWNSASLKTTIILRKWKI
ncbi:MAG: hypothetical protein V1746_03810 [bacterium]